MKILFIHRYCGLGGVTVGIRKKYLGLKKLGIGVDFLFLNYLGGKEIFDGLDINIYQSKDNDEIKRIIYKNNYDYISSIDCPEIHGLLGKLSTKFKILCEVRTPYPDHRMYVKDGSLFSNIRCIITPSETFKKLLRNELKTSKNIPIHVIPNSVEDRFLNSDNKCRDGFKASIQRRYIAWMGRMDYLKNYQKALKIAEKVSEFRDDVEFFIVGRFPSGNDSQLFSEIIRFKEKVNFKWLPFIKHQKVHNFYRLLRESGGCFLSTSQGEAQSNTVLESMASQCPVILTDIGVFKELIEDGRCGAIYKSGNLKSAVNSINRVLDDKIYRAAITKNAYAKVKENFTLERVSLKWKELFESLE